MTTPREQSIIDTRLHNPCATLQQIGDKYGISRERVRQILYRNKVRTSRLSTRKTYTCNHCGNQFKSSNPRMFCSIKCYSNSRRVWLICSECGGLIHRMQSLMYRYDNPKVHRDKNTVFCNRVCQGKYLGKHYGFPIQVNREYRKGTSYQDLIPEIKVRFNLGEKANQIAKSLNIPGGTIYYLLKERVYDRNQRPQKTTVE